MCRKRSIAKVAKQKFDFLETVSAESINLLNSTKKKKRKKDKFSGLNKTAVLSVSGSNSTITDSAPGFQQKRNIGNQQNQFDKNSSNKDLNFIPLSDFIPLETTAKNKSLSHKTSQIRTKKVKSKMDRRSQIRKGRIQKNEVLSKTEKNVSKKEKRIKNIANILQAKQNKSSTLTDFLNML